jgi:hypothetical protein
MATVSRLADENAAIDEAENLRVHSSILGATIPSP